MVQQEEMRHGVVFSAAFPLRGISRKRIRGKADTWAGWTLSFIHWFRLAVTLPFPWYLASDVAIASSGEEINVDIHPGIQV